LEITVPIKELQQRLTQVGVIRLGEKKKTSGGKEFPAKLETLRFTSPSRPLIDAVAAKYGGTVRPWQSTTGPQWEVITQTKEIPVLVPPQNIDPNYELWGNGFRSRMCDGETERIRNQACMCAAKRECKPTTRMSLMLAEIPSLGTWKLESHGWNAAAELPMLADSIARAPQPIPARLEVQARQKKLLDPSKPQDKQVETRNYMVPVLHFDFVTPAQAFGGQIAAAAQQALGGGQPAAAIGAAPADGGEKLTPAEVVRLAGFVRSVAQLQALWKDAAKDGALTADVRKVLEARAAELGPKPSTPTGEARPAPAAAPVQSAADPEPTAPPAEEVAVGEVEPDTDTLWMQILKAAGDRKWNTDGVEQRVYGRFKKTSDEINGWEMATLLDEIKSGVIA
jgi:hypothetical protein